MRKFFVLAALTSSSLPAMAQPAADSSKTLGEVVVSATKSPVKSSATGKVVIVINRADIERAGSRDITQVLSEQGGLFINGAFSNAGKDRNLYLRGARVDHTLITIDGVPVYDASGIGSNFDLRLIPIETVERIEVLKGSQGTLYGSDAIAGVINIITRKAGAGKTQGSALLSYGSYNTLNTAANVNGRVGGFDYAAGATYLDTKSISEAATAPGAPKAFENNPYRQQSGNVAFGYRFSPKAHLQAYLRYTKVNGNLDAGYYSDALDYTYRSENIQPGLRGEFTLGKGILRTLYNYNNTERSYVDDSTLTPNLYSKYDRSAYRAGEHFAEAYYSLHISRSVQFTAGADYRRANMKQYNFSLPAWTGNPESVLSDDSLQHSQVGVYANGLWNGKNGFSIEAGARYNNHSRYGSNFSWNINPSYLWNNSVKLFANISTGYRTPSLYQLFSEYGNLDLNPEKSLNLEGGLQLLAAEGATTLRATYFNREVRDLMVFYTDPATFGSNYVNRDKQRDHGVELDARIRFNEHFQAKLFYTYADGEVTTKIGGKDTTVFNLYRRPKESFSTTFTTTWSRFSASAQLIAQGKIPEQYFDNATFTVNTVSLRSYVLLNLYAEYLVKRPGLRLFADLRNVTGEEYMENYGYNTPGFNAYGGVRFSF